MTEAEQRGAEDLVLNLRKLAPDHPDYIGEAKDLFLKIHANQLDPMWCQEFIGIMTKDLGPTCTRRSPHQVAVGNQRRLRRIRYTHWRL